MLKAYTDKRQKYLSTFLLIIILLSIIYTISNSIIILPNGDTYNMLEKRYKEDYVNILSYNTINIANKQIILLDFYRPEKYDLDFITGKNDLEKLNNIISYARSIPYSEYQNNPRQKEQGLNCQGTSLMIRDMCKQINIKCTIKYTSNHMYNIVTIKENEYKLDTIKGIMERIN